MKIRNREEQISAQYGNNKLKFDESTYHYSSSEKEDLFIKSQFQSPGEIEKYHVYRKEWHRRADEMDPGSFPLAVICELVSSCTLSCEMCYTITPEFQNSVVGIQRVLPWDVVTRIIDECVEIGVYSILFSWRGESTLYKSRGKDGKSHDFADVLEYARRKGILEVTSLTNGRILTDSLIEKIVKAQPNWISFSIDGLIGEYNKIRKPVKTDNGKEPFDIVINNLKKMITLRDEIGLKKPQIRTNTIYPPIAKNPESYRIFMEEIGVGLVTVNEILDFRGAELPEDAIMDDWFCQYPFQRLVVSANGIILPCPGAHNEEEELVLGRYLGTHEKEVTINGLSKIIKFEETSLKDAWESKKMKNIQILHRENRRKELLACKHCRHGAKKHGATWIPEEWDMEKMEWVGGVWRE